MPKHITHVISPRQIFERAQVPEEVLVPAAVAAVVLALRAVYKKVEDRYSPERKGRQPVDTRGWTLEFRATRDELDGGYIADCPQFPGAMSQGETEREAFEGLAGAVGGILHLRVQRALRDSDADVSPVRTVHTVSIPLP